MTRVKRSIHLKHADPSRRTPKADRPAAIYELPAGPAAVVRPADVPTAEPGDPEDRSLTLLDAWHRAESVAEREQLMEQIVLLHLDLCHRLAKRYANRGIEFDDLVQVARLGLIGAVRRYRLGTPTFMPFAVTTITGELKRYFRDQGWTVRPPRRLQELRAQAAAARSQAEQDLQATVCTAEVSARLQSSVPEVAEAENLGSSFRPLPLEVPGGSAIASADWLGSDDHELELVPDILSLRAAVAMLDHRDQLILQLRFGHELTQAEIGGRLGVSQMQVSRLISRILDQLRETLDPAEAAA